MAVVATGFFDGVHLGHRKVISELVSSSRQKGEEALVVTFSQHPRTLFQRDALGLRLLSSREEKTALLLSLGVDRVETLDFTPALASLEARSYISEVLKARYGASGVVLGYDNRFGSDCLSTDELSALIRSEGLDCKLVPPLVMGSDTVSSTKIRALLDKGEVSAAAAMLGYAYSLKGVVVPGKQLGRTLGFPTANLCISDPLKQIPARGVYLSRTTVMGESYPSMTNVGDIVETNIFDFSRDIYSMEISVSFIARIRPMLPFSNLDELSERLRRDEFRCRAMLSEMHQG